MPLAAIATPILFAILKIVTIALIGYLLARRNLLHPTATADLSNLVIKVFVPCLIFANASPGFTGLSIKSVLCVVLAAPIILAVGYLGGHAAYRLLKIDPKYRIAVICASTFENSAYLPITVATAILPAMAAFLPVNPATNTLTIAGTGVIYISLFGLLYSPLFWGLGFWWLQSEGEPGGAPQVFGWPKLLTPPVIAILAGSFFGLTPLHLAFTPEGSPLYFLYSAIEDIGKVTIPLANLILGAMLATATAANRSNIGNVIASVLVKLIFVPGVCLAILWGLKKYWMGESLLGVAAFVIFVQSLTPPATNLAIMVKGSGERVTNFTQETIPAILLAAYLLAILTMPVWLILFMRMLATR